MTMKKTTIDIPIYQCKLTIILDKDLSYIEKMYGTKPLNDYGAITMRVPHEFLEYAMAFEYTDGTIIAHEIVHLKNYIYQDKGIELDRFNDEPEAYLTGWLFTQIETFLKQ
tara:strand:+ start:1195 stop:1527 length:333 start_codon:yes stop_codon:yes gene_type:complete